MLGANWTGTYKGILFYVDRSAADQSPSLGGGGALSLIGTIYMPTQTLDVGGNSGNATNIQGDIIVNDLTMHGTSGITMTLNPALKFDINQVALVR